MHPNDQNFRVLKLGGLARTALQAALVCGLIAISIAAGCDRTTPSSPVTSTSGAHATRPNILWVVWDTVRADHLSVYGYERETTPLLKRWAARARVFENCVTAGTPTIPSHASMFTGLLPIEHGASHAHEYLDSEHETIAEILAAAGYQTYLFSANAFVSADQNYAQGFQTVEHPWSPRYQEQALKIVRAKLDPQDKSSELTQSLNSPKVQKQHIKAAGELAIGGLKDWLAARDAKQPYFAFINWMEAHRQLIPPRRFREKMMTPAQVKASYSVDRAWIPMWMYTFGLSEYAPEEIELTRATYDAALLELDEMFHRLLSELETAGALRNTVVILTSDHGEHLGEHHMMDHQYSVYEEVAHVPLIIFDPDRFPAGRERGPVMNFDLFPTILEIAGVKSSRPAGGQAESLLRPVAPRRRLCGYPAAFESALKDVKSAVERRGSDRRFNHKPWMRSLRAYYDGEYKLIWGSDGRCELYKIAPQPAQPEASLLPRGNVAEETDLATTEPEVLARMTASMNAYMSKLKKHVPARPPPPREKDAEARLGAIGYAGGNGGDDEPDEDDDARPRSPGPRPASAGSPTTAPGSAPGP